MGPDQHPIWVQFKKGDKQAYAHIYYQYFDQLYDYGCRLSAHTELVEDCIQELFLHLWKKRAQLPEVESVKYYLLKSLRNSILNELKNRSKFTGHEPFAHFALELSTEEKLISDQELIQKKERLQMEISKLSRREKEVIYLLFYDNLTHEEAAEVLSLKIRTVYNLANLAISKMKKQVKKSLLTYHHISILFCLSFVF